MGPKWSSDVCPRFCAKLVTFNRANIWEKGELTVAQLLDVNIYSIVVPPGPHPEWDPTVLGSVQSCKRISFQKI